MSCVPRVWLNNLNVLANIVNGDFLLSVYFVYFSVVDIEGLSATFD